MDCPKCEKKMGVLQTYMAGGNGESRNLKCPACGYRASSVTFLVELRRPSGRKIGARALAVKIERGELRSPLDDGEVGGS